MIKFPECDGIGTKICCCLAILSIDNSVFSIIKAQKDEAEKNRILEWSS